MARRQCAEPRGSVAAAHLRCQAMATTARPPADAPVVLSHRARMAVLGATLLGGFLTDHVSWHWVFYVNLPIGIAALAVIAAVLPTVRRTSGSWRDIDFLGITLFTAGVVPVLIGLSNKGQPGAGGVLPGWTSP